MGLHEDFMEIQAAAKADEEYLPLLEKWMRAMKCLQKRSVMAEFRLKQARERSNEDSRK